MRQKEIPVVLVSSVMSLYEGAKTRVDSELSEEFEVKVEMHQGFVPLSFVFCSCGRCCHRIGKRVCYVSCCILMT